MVLALARIGILREKKQGLCVRFFILRGLAPKVPQVSQQKFFPVRTVLLSFLYAL